MTQKIRARLAGDRGDLVVDALVGVLITAFVFMIVAAISVSAASTTSMLTSDTQRQAYLASRTAELSKDLDTVPTVPKTTRERVGGEMVSVTTWQSVGERVATVYALSPAVDARTDCTMPSEISARGCLVSQVGIPIEKDDVVQSLLISSTAGITSRDGANIAAGQFATAQSAVGAKEVRYVAKISSSSAGKLTFTSGAEVLLDVPFKAGQDGYLYGSVYLNGSRDVQIRSSVAAHVSYLLVYAAPGEEK